MRKPFASAALAAAALSVLLAAPGPAASAEPQFTTDFRLEDCEFSSRGGNAYWSLEPGTRLLLRGEEDGETLTVRILALDDTRAITFRSAQGERLRVKARVIEEREWVDDELVEVSRNFYARCEQTDDVYYFGESVDIYEDGEVVSHDGAWLAGRNGAQPGLIMPGTFLLGARYFQEVAPGVALDRAEHTAMGLTVPVPAGTFQRCVEVTETTPLEPGAEDTKLYCPGVGLVADGPAELVRFFVPEDEDDDDEDDDEEDDDEEDDD